MKFERIMSRTNHEVERAIFSLFKAFNLYSIFWAKVFASSCFLISCLNRLWNFDVSLRTWVRKNHSQLNGIVYGRSSMVSYKETTTNGCAWNIRFIFTRNIYKRRTAKVVSSCQFHILLPLKWVIQLICLSCGRNSVSLSFKA